MIAFKPSVIITVICDFLRVFCIRKKKKKKIDLRKSNAINTSKIRKLRKCGKGNLERRKLRGRNNNPFKQDY